jgi:hypothetical protein
MDGHAGAFAPVIRLGAANTGMESSFCPAESSELSKVPFLNRRLLPAFFHEIVRHAGQKLKNAGEILRHFPQHDFIAPPENFDLGNVKMKLLG